MVDENCLLTMPSQLLAPADAGADFLLSCWPQQVLGQTSFSAAGPSRCWSRLPSQLLAPADAGADFLLSCWPQQVLEQTSFSAAGPSRCWSRLPSQLLAPADAGADFPLLCVRPIQSTLLKLDSRTICSAMHTLLLVDC